MSQVMIFRSYQFELFGAFYLKGGRTTRAFSKETSLMLNCCLSWRRGTGRETLGTVETRDTFINVKMQNSTAQRNLSHFQFKSSEIAAGRFKGVVSLQAGTLKYRNIHRKNEEYKWLQPFLKHFKTHSVFGGSESDFCCTEADALEDWAKWSNFHSSNSSMCSVNSHNFIRKHWKSGILQNIVLFPKFPILFATLLTFRIRYCWFLWLHAAF